MAPAFRFAVLAAVSSKPQVKNKRQEEKGSLDDQVNTSRRFGLSQGGMETAGPYILDGYSRSKYVDLTKALAEIPPLADCINEAEANQYDVLIVDNLERFGDLGMIYTYFKYNVKKQIISARQPTPIHDPRTYDPWADESSNIMRHVEGIIDGYRKNKLHRGWAIGVPMRVDKGLHPLSLPFGYHPTAKGEPARLTHEEAGLLRQLKDMFLSGASYVELVRCANASGIQAPHREKWHRSSIKLMLTNPFYAGMVTLGKKHERKWTPRSGWELKPGKHEAVWSEADYRAILYEERKRREVNRHHQMKFPFTSLVYCGKCGERIHKTGRVEKSVMACSHGHWHKPYGEAVQILAQAIVTEYKKYQFAPPQPIDLAPLHERLTTITEDRTHVQEMTRARIYSLEQGTREINALDEEEADIKRKIQRAEEVERSRDERSAERNKLQVERLPYIIEYGNPAEVNHMLMMFIERIEVSGDEITVVWRQ